ncbi:MAG: hypothetical protein U9Q92_00560 [archaeon]|nr:hypothetical protein [archaeon]
MQKLKKNGQASTEYLIVIGISLLLLTPIILIGNNALVDLKHTSDSVVAQDAVDQIKEMSQIVYAQGSPAKMTRKVKFPGNIISTTVSDQTIVIRLSYKSLSTDRHATMDFNVSGSLPTTSGTHKICVEAIDYGVNITETP